MNLSGPGLGNAFRLTDPAERPSAFTEAAVRGCDKQGYCRITTYQLFILVTNILNDKETMHSIKQKILSCEGGFVI